ncbi:hypothetical protein BHM03_00047616 [Ensete ventricosum]|nr:hypothetical protein BHM03_00047616 [Ensete ventricosum]
MVSELSERSNKGRPPTARPAVGGRLDARRWLPVGVVAAHGHGRLQLAPRGGRLQGAHKGLSPETSRAASRGGRRRRPCPRARAVIACAGVATATIAAT